MYMPWAFFAVTDLLNSLASSILLSDCKAGTLCLQKGLDAEFHHRAELSIDAISRPTSSSICLAPVVLAVEEKTCSDNRARDKTEKTHTMSSSVFRRMCLRAIRACHSWLVTNRVRTHTHTQACTYMYACTHTHVPAACTILTTVHTLDDILPTVAIMHRLALASFLHVSEAVSLTRTCLPVFPGNQRQWQQVFSMCRLE